MGTGEKNDIASVEEIDASSIEGKIFKDEERLAAEKKLVWKLDSRLMPAIFVVFIMNYVCLRASPPSHKTSFC